MKTIHIAWPIMAIVLTSGARATADAPAATLLYLDQPGWQQAGRETKAALAADFMRVFCGNPAMPPADLIDCLDHADGGGPIFERALACIATTPAHR
jgi:hypothetical protein